MNVVIALFFATKYWGSKEEIMPVAGKIKETFSPVKTVTVIDGDLTELFKGSECDTIVIVPCSGSVQPDIIKACADFSNKVIFAPYVEGNFDAQTTDKILYCNAAPTLMDTYSVLKRTTDIRLIKTTAQLKAYLKAQEAVKKIKGTRIAVIEQPEPWVISVEKDLSVYNDKTGVNMVKIPQSELIDIYKSIDKDEVKDIYDYFKNGADQIIEPTDEDLQNASKMAGAMLKIIRKYKCMGMAIACFNLITKTGINPCLGVSYINGETPYFAACEGDVDSAVTMLFIRALTDDAPWMANPNLGQDETVNFVHCTAPIKGHKYILRSHHETGIGASLDVKYDIGADVSLFRYSGVENKMTINSGKTVAGRYEPSCRTQLHIALDNYKGYIENVLGCHQVMSFADIKEQMQEFAIILGIEII